MAKIKLRRDTAANWSNLANNPILASGEPGYETDTGKLKIGNGSTAWNSLSYFDDKVTDLSSFAGHIVPSTDNTYDLGSPTKQWRDIFVSGGSVYIGDIKLSNDSGTLSIQRVTDAGTVDEEPVPDTPGVVTTDRLINDDNTLVLKDDGSVELNGQPFTGGGEAANLGDITFDGITIQGVGDPEGAGGIQLSPDPSMVETGQYFRFRGGDYPTHLHLDTGDNVAYDQYFGDDGKYLKLAKEGPIIIGTGGHTWTFDDSGASLTLPGNIITNANSATIGTANASVYLDSTNRVAKIIAKKHFNRSFGQDGVTLTYTSATVTAAFAVNQGLYFKQLLSRLFAHFDGGDNFVYDYSNVTLTINPDTENLASTVTNVVPDANDPPTYTITLATAHAEPIIINDIVFDYDYNNTIGLDVDNDRFGIATDDDDLELISSRDIDLMAADDIRLQAGSVMSIELVQNDDQSNTDGIEIITTSAAGSKNWKFQFDGNLAVPGNIVHNTSPGLTIGSSYSVYIVGDQGDNNRTWTFDGTSGDLQLPNGTIIADDDNNTQIRVPAAIPGTWKEWTFDASGNLNVPGGIVAEYEEDFTITTSYLALSSPPGPATNTLTFAANGDLTVPERILGTADLTLRAAAGYTTNIEAGVDGSIEIGYQGNPPANIYIGTATEGYTTAVRIQSDRITISADVPTSSIGQSGDGAGQIAFSSTYIYYCTATYDGTTDIWKRVALTGGAW